jgi:hypothetical protein
VKTRRRKAGSLSAVVGRATLQRKFIGHDDEFAVALVQYRTLGGAREDFMNNILDIVTMFHRMAPGSTGQLHPRRAIGGIVQGGEVAPE